MSSNERKALGIKAREYVMSEFSMQTTIDMWHESLLKLSNNWKAGERVVPRYSITEL